MSRWYIPILIAAAFIAGCKDEPAKTPPTPTPPATKPADAPKVTPPKIDVPKVDVPKVDVPKVDVPKVDTPKVDAAKEEGSKLLDQLDAAVKAAKLTDAESIVSKLDAIKDKLPADLQTKFETLKKALADLKAKGSTALPKLPGNANK